MENHFIEDRSGGDVSHLSGTGHGGEKENPICGNEVNPQNNTQQPEDSSSFNPQSMEYLANYLAKVLEKTISEKLQVSQSGKGSNGFEKVVISYLEQLYNGITAPERGTDQRYYTTLRLLRNQDISTEKLDSITRELQTLRQIVDNQAKVIEEQAAIIKKQHENIIRYENDVIYKTQKDLIMELIGIADQLRYTLNDYVQQDDFDSLYNSIGDLTEWVDGSLQAVAVRKCVSTDSKELDRKRQEIVEIQETDNPNEDCKIESLLPGYIWSVPMVGSNEMRDEGERPKAYEFMIRPEQVVRLKYVKPLEKPSIQEQPGQATEVIRTADNSDTEFLEKETPVCERVGDVQDTSDSHDDDIDEKKPPMSEWL